ncbi:MAG TPA: alpha/beta fold hydrolase [Candidatus Eisenbacteria bacterium]|nr:alpha/beta fold hydrolase [Candidatus Eisenbacteria bacterium]
MYKTEASTGLFLICILGLFCLSTSIFKQQDQALARQYIQTIKYRNLVIDLGDGVKTKAQLTYPATGKGPFPAVLLIHGSGAQDMNETLTKNAKPFWQIAQYLSERGFAVLRYDKRGVGATSYTISNSNVYGNATANDFIHDAEKALNVLIQQPEVDSKRISILGHSEGTIYAPRIAIDNSTKVKNVILMAALAQNPTRVVEYATDVSLPLEYAMQVLDKNHTGQISIQQIANAPVLLKFLPLPHSLLRANNTKTITTTIAKVFGTTGYISIGKQLKPMLVKTYENTTSFNPSNACILNPSNVGLCPILWRSLANMIPNLSIIGNVSKSTGILIFHGENDSQVPVQEAFLLQQRLTDVNHPDHTLITYPNLGHAFYPSSQWFTEIGPVPPYVLADLYVWLEAHSGLTQPLLLLLHPL